MKSIWWTVRAQAHAGLAATVMPEMSKMISMKGFVNYRTVF